MKGSGWFRATRERLERERVFAIVGALFILIFTSALCLLIVEHGYPDSQIREFWDAVWWSIVTVATVGYGDLVPKSPLGRLLGAATILGGVVLLSITTATIASVFVEKKIREERGLEAVKLKGHVVLCGWNDSAEELVEGLVRESGERRLKLVLVNDLPPEEMDVLRQKYPDHDLEYVRGDFVYEGVLKKANISSASVVIVVPDLSGGRAKERADERTVLATLAIKSLAPHTRTCAEVLDGANRAHLMRANVDEVIVRGERTGVFMAGAALSPGLTAVLDEIFSLESETGFWGMEIPSHFVGRPVREFRDHLSKEGLLLIAIAKERKGMDLSDILSHDMSAVDAFIKKKFEEAEVPLLQKGRGYHAKVNPPEDSLIEARDMAFVLGPRHR